MKLTQGESTRILLAVPREMWFYREMASRPLDPRLVKAGDTEYIMQVLGGSAGIDPRGAACGARGPSLGGTAPGRVSSRPSAATPRLGGAWACHEAGSTLRPLPVGSLAA